MSDMQTVTIPHKYLITSFITFISFNTIKITWIICNVSGSTRICLELRNFIYVDVHCSKGMHVVLPPQHNLGHTRFYRLLHSGLSFHIFDKKLHILDYSFSVGLVNFGHYCTAVGSGSFHCFSHRNGHYCVVFGYDSLHCLCVHNFVKVVCLVYSACHASLTVIDLTLHLAVQSRFVHDSRER